MNALVGDEEKVYQIFTLDIFYFKKGEEKYTNEFDAVEFARTQRKLKLLMNSLMDENKRFLAPYQKLNAISLLSDSDSNNSDNSAYSKIPKMHSKSEIKKRHRSSINEFFVNSYLFISFHFCA